MYLKTIIAQGFKSFADKITIDLTNGISGIVGPNGSGKSNVVDAVRWVMGEQSVKSLRGDSSMTDVIFSGSKSRNAANSATITLIFDNSDHYLNIDYSEVSIKRRVYSDGTNEYYLNGEKCRLKDISDILMDTGIAKESFNIISQGKIEEILSTKATDKRIIFEEAAGVLKYKKRKEEALRKLEIAQDNMIRVDDIIGELKEQIEPLREQKDKAIKYLDAKKELESIEIALITNDITTFNDKYQSNKEKIDEINSELLNLNTNNSLSLSKIEEYKLRISKYDVKIKDKQNELIDLSMQCEKINSEKNIILERQKYKVEDVKLHNNIVNLKEEELNLSNLITDINLDIKNKNNDIKNNNDKLLNEQNNLNTLKVIKEKINNELSTNIRDISKVKNDILVLRNSIENNSLLPYSVKNILDNPKLKGVHNVFGSLIEIDEKYMTAISTALGLNTNNIVVESEETAKDCINYLKNNGIGRATFYPLNIMKAKYIDEKVLEKISSIEGFIDIASNLVKYDEKYKNIILNQLGNVIVTDNIDNANKIAKLINNMYRIVTLDGDILNVGGSITGGKKNTNRNIINEKLELELLIKKETSLLDKIKLLEDKINEQDNLIKYSENKLYLINKDKIELNDYINLKNNTLADYNNRLDNIRKQINGTNNILNNTLSDEENKILNDYYDSVKLKNKCKNELDILNNDRDSVKSELEEFEHDNSKNSTLYNSKLKELNNLEIELNRFDVKLDTLLNTLNETYSITYEKAASTYLLEIDVDIARNKVNSLKKIIRDIGDVNTFAPEEFDKVNERYEFLTKQRQDLENAQATLYDIISEMDEVMKTEFIKTFKVIKENFSITFKELFKGGNADLKLTDPNNILETGIEIVASPPGKKLTSINLLSGGEKTFTAISLLFAILKSRPVPFCILDEVEAALDEANVDSFGEYLNKFKDKTQFILITHKKKTMEFVDVLYGITMQESGVSKLVSVKLEELK